jgi:phosphate transport system substrate-binding protein
MVAVAAFLIVGCGTKGNRSARINGAGSSFVFPAMAKWTSEYNTQKSTQIDYISAGSGAGIQQMTEKTVTFGCSDMPMKKEQLDKAKELGGDVVHIPLVIGGVVPAYNLEGVNKPLRFTGPILADIYLGRVKKWNDPALKEVNPDVSLPDVDIVPVFRADSSGSSAIFSEYLAKVSPEFRKNVGVGTSPNWPKGVGIGQRDSAGVIGHVNRSPGSICYVELAFAVKNKIAYGSIKNMSGQFVTANAESLTASATAALAEKPLTEPYSLNDLTWPLTDCPGEKSYPLAGFAYAIIYKNQPKSRGQVLVDFLRWATTTGQTHSRELDYAPLPDELQKRIEEKLSSVVLKD